VGHSQESSHTLHVGIAGGASAVDPLIALRLCVVAVEVGVLERAVVDADHEIINARHHRLGRVRGEGMGWSR
jgi:hypothetical protein